MTEFNVLMDFVRDTRDQQQKYLETIRQENTALIERYRSQSLELISRLESQFEKTAKEFSKDLKDSRTDIMGELSNVRGWFASTIITIVLTGLVGCGGIILAIVLTARGGQ